MDAIDVHWQDEWIKKLWYIDTMEYYSAIKKNAFESVLMRWMNLDPIIQREVSHKEKQISYTHTYVWNLERQYWWNYLQGSSGDTDREQTMDTGLGEEGEGGTYGESNTETYITMCKIDSQQEFAVWLRELKLVLTT